MKLDKDILTGIIVCAVLLFAWQPICRYLGLIPETPAVVQQAAEPEKAENTAVAAPVPATTPVIIEEVPEIKAENVILSNRDMILTIDPVKGEITKITLEKYLNSEQTGPVELDQLMRNQNTLGALGIINIAAPFKVQAIVKQELNPEKFLLTRKIVSPDFPQGLLLTQEWKIAATGYTTDYQVSFSNPSKQGVIVKSMIVGSGDLPPWHVNSGDKIRMPSHRLDFQTANGKYTDIKADAKDKKFAPLSGEQILWTAVSNKYFCSILNPEKTCTLWVAREKFDYAGTETPVIASGAEIPAFTLAPDASTTMQFKFYSGPKITDSLRAFNPAAERVMHLAWGPLDYLARFLLWLLVKFNTLVKSYGLSIILLTVLVRAVFYPVTAKSNASMRKMSLVQPQLKELREKYKDNPQLMNAKMMELYRKEGVNPFGGCLPILLQIPVFFALYATLEGTVELRQVSFLWCKNLAAADTVATIPLYFFDLPINPLVIAMTLLMVVQQRMTPMSGDPMQKKMMMMMPVIMLVFLYNLPSGLTLYWTVSNIFSIVQLKLQQRAGKTTAPAQNR